MGAQQAPRCGAHAGPLAVRALGAVAEQPALELLPQPERRLATMVLHRRRVGLLRRPAMPNRERYTDGSPLNSRAAPSAVHAPLLVGLLRASGPRMCAADDEWRTCRIGRIVCRARCNSALRCCQGKTAVECGLRPGAGTERVRRRRRDGPWLLPDAPGVRRRVCRNDRLRQLHLRAYWSRPVQWDELQVLHGARDCPSAAPQASHAYLSSREACVSLMAHSSRPCYGVVANTNCA